MIHEIHPLDVPDLLSNTADGAEIWLRKHDSNERLNECHIEINGVRYIQTITAPLRKSLSEYPKLK